MCLSTDFINKDSYYRQSEGAEMGSPLSNYCQYLYGEYSEEIALESAN